MLASKSTSICTSYFATKVSIALYLIGKCRYSDLLAMTFPERETSFCGVDRFPLVVMAVLVVFEIGNTLDKTCGVRSHFYSVSVRQFHSNLKFFDAHKFSA